MAAAKANIQYYDLDAAMMFQNQPTDGGITHEGRLITLPNTPGSASVFSTTKRANEVTRDADEKSNCTSSHFLD
ncbi:hypothetical protein [Secundilactobacillus collinoides]|uniref:hypothetical protein n=1 Tax=Secundilactobacillus collinoides TaxID=33960 RepID=UPI0034E2AFCB